MFREETEKPPEKKTFLAPFTEFSEKTKKALFLKD